MGPPETALIPMELSTRHCLRANLDKGQTEAVATVLMRFRDCDTE